MMASDFFTVFPVVLMFLLLLLELLVLYMDLCMVGQTRLACLDSHFKELIIVLTVVTLAMLSVGKCTFFLYIYIYILS